MHYGLETWRAAAVSILLISLVMITRTRAVIRIGNKAAPLNSKYGNIQIS